MDGPGIAVTQETSFTPRRRADRRSGLHDLVREMATEWITHAGHPDLQAILVSRLRQLVPAKTVRLSELSNAPASRLDQPIRARDYVAFAVPVADSTRRIVLEASFPGGRALDEWSCQLLEASASLATLLFEAERLSRLHETPSGGSRDGAAPLIGSSLVMQSLRERVERVATTDFTVLIEGESDP